MIHTGDCIEVMAGMPADSVDAVVTDPPYGLEFMGKSWDSFKTYAGGNPNLKPQGVAIAAEWNGVNAQVSPGYRQKNPRCRKCGKLSRGNGACRCPQPDLDMRNAESGYQFQYWCEAWGREALRVTKPGGYLLAFGGTRTHHRLVCGLEDAGWIIRDELDWIYASGFPKGKANLKPAHEPIVLARKPGPLRPLAIDACRIGTADGHGGGATASESGWFGDEPYEKGSGFVASTQGRWPSNLLLSDPELFDVVNPYVVGSGAVQQSIPSGEVKRTTVQGFSTGKYSGAIGVGDHTYFEGVTDYGDSGGYSRFFIIPKADRGDREPVLRGQLEAVERDQNGSPVRNARCSDCGKVKFAAADARCQCENPTWVPSSTGRDNSHPTVKPTDLMRHLVRLVTPTGGTVLDPFLGSGSTAIACELEGFLWIGIEKEAEYVVIANARLNGTQKGLGLADVR